jgi:hypothetical protein
VWSEKDLVRRANRRLAVRHAEEVSGNVAAACRYFGISRNIFYRWKRRWGGEGLDGLKDCSSAPLHCPTITHPEVVEKIIHLRQYYHFGPLKIEVYLRRYHDVLTRERSAPADTSQPKQAGWVQPVNATPDVTRGVRRWGPCIAVGGAAAFWSLMRTGVVLDDAAAVAGVSKSAWRGRGVRRW